jgi:hypothetical protein
MTTQRPGIRHVNAAKELLNIDFETGPASLDVEAAKAYALLGIAEALGDIALSLREAADELDGGSQS